MILNVGVIFEGSFPRTTRKYILYKEMYKEMYVSVVFFAALYICKVEKSMRNIYPREIDRNVAFIIFSYHFGESLIRRNRALRVFKDPVRGPL